MPKIIWEYVSNSLDNSKEGVTAVVAVEITSNYARISDNGLGMSREELSNFFRMHGENLQRKRGRKSRGRFGTGKSAAFGLANLLRIDTVKGRLRNVVELHRRDIELAQNGQPFPVCDIHVDEATDQEDGTLVEIREFNIARMDVDKVISFIERNLSRSHQRAHVTINGHECRFEEPPSIESRECVPPPEVAERIGLVTLTIKISPVPLDDDIKGIDILSRGVWHGNTLAGIERRDRAGYIFGEVDVPILEDKNDEWAIPAFDNTRNNTLKRWKRAQRTCWRSIRLDTRLLRVLNGRTAMAATERFWRISRIRRCAACETTTASRTGDGRGTLYEMACIIYECARVAATNCTAHHGQRQRPLCGCLSRIHLWLYFWVGLQKN